MKVSEYLYFGKYYFTSPESDLFGQSASSSSKNMTHGAEFLAR